MQFNIYYKIMMDNIDAITNPNIKTNIYPSIKMLTKTRNRVFANRNINLTTFLDIMKSVMGLCHHLMITCLWTA